MLPFTNMSGDPEQEYFSDGISEDIITALSKLRWFFVIARNSSFTYKGKAVHMKQVAEELGVGYVLEGSVRKGGDRVRITAQLNDAATGSHIWAERYDRDLADVFAVQDEITEAIVAAIEPQLYAAENFRAQRKPPDSMDAWDLVMRALSHYWRVTRQDNVVAQALLEKAIAIDPDYGQASGVLAASHMFCVHMGWADMASVAPIAERAALGGDPRRWRGPLGASRVGARPFVWRVASTIRSPNSSWRCASIQISLLLKAITVWPYPTAGAGRKPLKRRAAPCASVRVIRFWRSIMASPLTRSLSDATTTRRCGWRVRRCASAPILLARTACLPPQPVWRVKPRSPQPGLEELRRAQPNISLAWIAKEMPMKLDAEREHYLEAFRRAGLD